MDIERFCDVTGRLLKLSGLFLLSMILAGLWITLRDVDRTVKSADAFVQSTQKHVDVTLTNADRLIIITGVAATEAQKASKEQRTYLKGLDAQVSTSLTEFNKTLVAAQNTLNTTSDTVADVKPVLAEAQKTIAAAQPALEQLTQASAGINKLANSDDIPKTLTAVRSTADEANKSMQDVQYVADYYKTELTKPKKWFTEAFGKVLEWSYYARGIF